MKKLKNHPLVELLMEQYGSMRLPTHRSGTRSFSISSPSTSTSKNTTSGEFNVEVPVQDVDTKVKIKYGHATGMLDDVTISWGNESHNVDFEETGDKAGELETSNLMLYVAYSEDDKWRFIVEVNVDKESDEVLDVDWDTLEIAIDDSKVGAMDDDDVDRAFTIDAPDRSLQEQLQKLAGIRPLYTLNENQPTVFDDESMDELGDIISKYVEDPDDVQRELDRFDDGGFDNMSDMVTANLDRDPEYKAWYNKLHSIKGDEIEISLEDLDFETLKKSFPNKYKKEKFIRPQTDEPYYEDAVSFPNLDDSRMEIGDILALEDWKDKTSRRFGNVTIILKPNAKNWFDEVFVDDEAFNQTRDQLMRGKASAMQRDQELGRSIDENSHVLKENLQRRAGIIK
tara:strand:+ start:603 stop:1796 length:1194 start_codon:yes stop_codon:yes gene_type:complete